MEPAREIDVAGFADDTLVRRALELLAEATGRGVARADREAHPRRGRARRRQLRRSDRALLANATLDEPLPRDRLAALAARSAPTSRSSSPTRRNSAPGRHRPAAARSAAGLLDRAGPPARRRSRPPPTSIERSIAGGDGFANGAKRCCPDSPTFAGRATSRRCRRTTWRARRSPRNFARSEPSAPTSAAPVRPSTGSSGSSRKRSRQAAEFDPAGGSGSRHQRGTVERDEHGHRDRARELASGRWLREHRVRTAPVDRRSR